MFSTRPMPYVYMCIHKVTGEFYIGYRFYNTKLGRCSHDDLPQYKTSSNKVKPRFDEFDWVIVAEFFNKEDAYWFEQDLIIENLNNPLLLNGTYHNRATGNKAFRLDTHTPEHIAKRNNSKTITKTWAERKPEILAKRMETRVKHGHSLPEDQKYKPLTHHARRLLQWADDEFRDKMIRCHGSNSNSMKAKWADPVWREKTLLARKNGKKKGKHAPK